MIVWNITNQYPQKFVVDPTISLSGLSGANSVIINELIAIKARSKAQVTVIETKLEQQRI